jgi:hypothetical protein
MAELPSAQSASAVAAMLFGYCPEHIPTDRRSTLDTL